jgi:hypothetical protein
MAIKKYERHDFGNKLKTIIFTSQPIRSIEHLHGRQNELNRIEKALFMPGRHIFIYGDRGVGKSSLAATVANQYQSAESEYIDVSCSPDATLSSVVANIAYQSVNASRIHKIKNRNALSADLKYLKADRISESTLHDLHKEIHTLLDAVEVLREVASFHSNNPIVVIDEFDRMQSSAERNLFADLLKHLGDKNIDIKFIFTGVGKSLDELLGAHQSAIRQLETIELPKLGWEARWDIVINALREFQIEISRDIYIRIAAVSDGYPYYVHLITEKLLWHLFEQPMMVTKITWNDYYAALRDAIDSISAELKRPYEMAINQRSGDYEEVLWSTADSEFLLRFLKDMYSSYEYIMKQFPDKQSLDYEKFSSRIRSLKGQSCGAVLISESKPGLYSYREKMLRGYVRMQAEAHGIELIGETAGKKDGQYIHVPARTSGYYQSQIPKGVR